MVLTPLPMAFQRVGEAHWIRGATTSVPKVYPY